MAHCLYVGQLPAESLERTLAFSIELFRFNSWKLLRCLWTLSRVEEIGQTYIPYYALVARLQLSDWRRTKYKIDKNLKRYKSQWSRFASWECDEYSSVEIFQCRVCVIFKWKENLQSARFLSLATSQMRTKMLEIFEHLSTKWRDNRINYYSQSWQTKLSCIRISGTGVQGHKDWNKIKFVILNASGTPLKQNDNLKLRCSVVELFISIGISNCEKERRM